MLKLKTKSNDKIGMPVCSNELKVFKVMSSHRVCNSRGGNYGVYTKGFKYTQKITMLIN